MNILNLSNDDTGGNSYYTMRAINAHTPHEARAVKLMKSYLNYPADLYQPNNQQLRGLYKWADVIHIRNHWDALPSGFESKPVVVTFTNMSYRKRPGYYTLMCLDRGWTVTVSTIDLVKWNKAIWLPNPREDMLEQGRDRYDVFTIAHSPTKRVRKGTETIIKAVEGLNGVRLELIENTPYAECLLRKARCHMMIDQFTYGYGNSAIESWAFGQPVISHASINPEVPEFIKQELGYLPWLDVPENVRCLRDAIMSLKDDADLYRLMVSRGREWYNRHHTFDAIANQVVTIYEETIDGY